MNSGRVVVGTIGGGGRRDFTVIGDPVNTAARVEAATRMTGDDVLDHRGDAARARPGGDAFEERPVRPAEGQGRAGPPLRASVKRAPGQPFGTT